MNAIDNLKIDDMKKILYNFLVNLNLYYVISFQIL